ncbi:serine/threonine protein kinase [Saccharopolyspora lacisalsi]|uniref:non-specific serine/threonine protein kinase n=1 Tax=Halosaccharopolyspora lacisalsi TaxID=1000566 RepID=A0A839DY23_9PSEU|nr:serine/threonine-protein kinase [Halosaccharopolyspora lacisalsi]MBA8826862.1 serine/threonine protein kinase [Halosaccharopolyspora lacisalsi]
MSDSEDAPEGTPEQGRLISDRYRLDSRLGGGAMGSVWAGTDVVLGRPIAVKAVRLPPGVPDAEAAELRERTLREARAIAVVSHPNVITLYDVARDDGEPFVVMELMPSESLATVVNERGALDEQQLAVLADSVAAALEAAHRARIVHRDVKPGNVLLGPDGRIKLSDFGISRNLGEPTLTRTGIMLGTPAFIAPEVAAGETLTFAADLWGLGATLFAASEGCPPYDTDDNPMATVTSVVRGPVPLPSRTGPIGEVITGLMVKDPQQRLQLHEVRRRIQHALPEPGSHPLEGLLDPETPTVRALEQVGSDSDRTDDEQERTSQPEQQAPALADDPGPLPFTPTPPPPKRRSPWAVTALALSAVLVFALALGAGFTGSRALLGYDPLPSPQASQDQLPRLVPRFSTAKYPADGGEGNFTVPVPVEWAEFHSVRAGPPTESVAVHFVAPDGRTDLVVAHFDGYYSDGYTTQGYINTLPKIFGGSDKLFRLGANHPVPSDTGKRPDRQLSFTTEIRGVSTTSDPSTRRHSLMRLMPHQGDLWILRVTVPDADVAFGHSLFGSALRGFAPLP